MTTSTFNAAANAQPSSSGSLFTRVLAWFAKTNVQSTWADGARGL